MKVNELFEAQGSPGQGGKLKGGAYYAPQYDDEEKILRGSVADWLDKMGVTPADVAQAVEAVKKDPLVAQMKDEGLTLMSKPASEKRGTLNFMVTRKYPGHEYRTAYQVHANGQVRSGQVRRNEVKYITRLQSPKPRMKAGDPVGSLVMIYRAAMEEVLKKWKKAKAQNPQF
jgi:hypothetical protein